MEPLTFEPIIVEKPWGGRRLEQFGKKLPSAGLFGESWEVADLPADAVTSATRSRSRVTGGADEGATLADLIARYGSDLLGSARATELGDFPLLVKFLDARQHLSVQVHPTAHYVAHHPGTWLKTESWCVVDADPGAVLYKGFRPGVTMDQIQRAAGTREFAHLLEAVDAVPGDFHHLPAGVVHALGAGVLVAEIQSPSDTTFRLYDWAEEYGRVPRPLHIDEALQTVTLEPDGAVAIAALAGQGSRSLIETEHYWLAEHKLDGGRVPLADGGELRILMVIRGAMSITSDGRRLERSVGSTTMIPASLAAQTHVTVTEPGVMIEIGLV